MTKSYIALVNARKLCSLVLSPHTYTEISNWPLYFADHLGLVHGEYTLRFRRDFKLLLQANHPVKWPIQEIVIQDDYRLRSLKADPPSIIIDLGACIGMFSLYAKALFPKAKIYAFEPFAGYFPGLEKNIRLNSLGMGIIPYPLACYSETAVRLLKSGKTLKSPPLAAPSWIYSYKDSISLQGILDYNKLSTCDLLKIDVEGAEYDIIYSLPARMYRRIRRIHLEYHNLDVKTDLNGHSLKKWLEKNHFEVVQTKVPFQKMGMIFATNLAP
ncbi:MAG: hypothetical protein A3F04_00870 [Candidatus Chisholmbacteria bacterium RIFCSPHIGHO2_12_FULL_49_9]|uniref:Methyltransferase FkbM domain-containing protein n=1 Tax=Candidatus Chisholmbacteria bacterium RIFCSPHIGHO2_01_FULL_52_32 TaxID=1797591 RepID=A0A1G1VQJ5_9BACT|nr:MAG: hypothetical protein A2786_05695 [Candidatus Chisholmbacteria bacterium RIFCSPHIGHO2_01_FULL_52_32]OGY19154.1 MAG: hypothetical protein A3F04_00870 [Candidatus Chisholmbacteria bacterium RIFCSPHIGHO2_12_FULL_49_9]OGY20574.1 MAG: hypothetical protein A2900_05920 [Candidatus Chisholmbacteria bacterium RIFCSPLOWO2_01_FULL_50_28]